MDSKHPSLRPGNDLEIKCPKCKQITTIKVPAEKIAKPAQHKDEPDRSAIPEVSEMGWIVVHDEFTPEQTFPLKIGKNRIGRYSPDKPCEVMIKTNDTFMSRNHSVIEVKEKADGKLIYIISDIGSTNGTFINALRRLSEYDKIILLDGDTVQLGRTKIVLKTKESTQSSSEASRKVKREGYMKTVVITH
ncbi:FHA domain-containing protein [Dyadobacter helix]|uniref:FHA domain-containing protein n=1 Tax=Dyadobacter helix TaxID=2822344 RepID=UPI001BFCC952|nr:FHA domain-containing protein [Dyadobacter sp. CECT 9275]